MANGNDNTGWWGMSWEERRAMMQKMREERMAAMQDRKEGYAGKGGSKLDDINKARSELESYGPYEDYAAAMEAAARVRDYIKRFSGRGRPMHGNPRD